MNIQEWSQLAANYATILGVVGVFFVLYELMQQVRQLKRDSAKLLLDQWSGLMTTIAETEEFAALWLKGTSNFLSLSNIDKLRYGCIVGQFFRTAEGLKTLHDENALDEQVWRGLHRTIEDAVRYEGVRQWWETRKHWHSDHFQDYVSNCIANPPNRAMGYDEYGLANNRPGQTEQTPVG